jgi:glycosyltransferase involved in cell wall biosynthesis
MRPMRICFLSSMHTIMDKRVFDKEARTLVNAGYDVVHIAPDHDQRERREWVQDGVRLVSYTPFKGLVGRLRGIPKLYYMAKDLDARVYHCNEVDSWFVGVMLRVLDNRLCVFDVHEHYPEEFAETRFPPWMRPIVRGGLAVFMHILSWLTHRVVVAKTSLLADFSHMPDGHVVAVQNFVPIESLPSPVVRERNKDVLRMVHLGLFNRYRGWPELMQAMVQARCQTTELLVIGTINDGSKDEFKRMVVELGLQDRVEYQTWLPFDQAMEKVKRADVGLICFQPGLFNHIHALPHKMFDYMGAGLAVIAPDFAVEVSEIIQETQSGVLVDTADSDSIAQAIDLLCDDRQKMRELGQRGRQAVLNRYNWEAEGKILVDLYRDLDNGYPY